jgi:hypothetical protein
MKPSRQRYSTTPPSSALVDDGPPSSPVPAVEQWAMIPPSSHRQPQGVLSEHERRSRSARPTRSIRIAGEKYSTPTARRPIHEPARARPSAEPPIEHVGAGGVRSDREPKRTADHPNGGSHRSTRTPGPGARARPLPRRAVAAGALIHKRPLPRAEAAEPTALRRNTHKGAEGTRRSKRFETRMGSGCVTRAYPFDGVGGSITQSRIATHRSLDILRKAACE